MHITASALTLCAYGMCCQQRRKEVCHDLKSIFIQAHQRTRHAYRLQVPACKFTWTCGIAFTPPTLGVQITWTYGVAFLPPCMFRAVSNKTPTQNASRYRQVHFPQVPNCSCWHAIHLDSSRMSIFTACMLSPVTPWHGGPPITMSMSPASNRSQLST